MGRRKSMKLVPPRILKQQKPPHNHRHPPNIPPRLKIQQQQEQPSFRRLVPPRLMKQQLITRRPKLMMQEPTGMAIPHPHYPQQLIPQMHLLVQYYLMPPPFIINFQIQDQELNKEQPLELDESSALDYVRLTSFLRNKDDDSVLTPWNWNPVHGHLTSANKRLQSGTSSYFSFNVCEKWPH